MSSFSGLSPGEVATIERVLRERCGISFYASVRRLLHLAVADAALSLGETLPSFVWRLRADDPAAIGALIEHAVVGETYFFRQAEHLELLHGLVARELGATGLRIWSAGCASGEEPYSLAMSALAAGRDQDRVIATDISERALRMARAGVYGSWSLRRLAPHVRERFFAQTPGGARVIDEVRAGVSFRPHNLVRDAPLGPSFHAIFCRNVLIYFEQDIAEAVLRKLVSVLVPGGYLMLASAELPLAAKLSLESVGDGETVILRRPPELPAVRRISPVPRPLPPPKASNFEQARAAARDGALDDAEKLAREAARGGSLEAHLLLASLADARGELETALGTLDAALALEPALTMAHALRMTLLLRLGRADEAARARKQALDSLLGLDDTAELPGVEPMTAGGLRRALGGAD